MNNPDKQIRSGFLSVLSSVLAAFFGVQNRKNYEKDFRHGKAKDFVIVGLIMTAVLVLTVITIVKIVLSHAQ